MTYLLEVADMGISINAGAVHLLQQIVMEDFFELCAVVGVNGDEVNETSLGNKTKHATFALSALNGLPASHAPFTDISKLCLPVVNHLARLCINNLALL
jgi:hypothetical protein